MLLRCLLILVIVACTAAGQTKSPPAKGSSHTTEKAPGPPPIAILHTTAGDMKCELFPDKTPKTVENFIGLAMGTKDWKNPGNGQMEHNHPFYDGLTFHRVIPGFVIQSGDPTGTGNGGPGYEFEDELLPDLLFDRPGRLAMANSGPNTNGSQFFITQVELPNLNPCFEQAGCPRNLGPIAQGTQGWTIFGQCDNATVELAKKIAQGPCRRRACDGNNSQPDNPVKITHIEILNPPKPAKPATKHPARKKTGTQSK